MSDVIVNSDNSPRRRLGRGLTALLGGSAPAHEEVEVQDNSELRHIAVDLIDRNPYQPRRDFEPEALGELSDSIKEHGVLQPILIRAFGAGRYQLIAGERRLLASRKAGLTSMPCRIVDVVDKTAFEFALEENLKRKDLNDLEKALAFREYIETFQCSIEELAKQLSMNRSTVSNMLRLLELPDPVKNALSTGKISAGHARALLSLEAAEQLALCGRIQAESLSVRQTEATVKQLLKRHTTAEADALATAQATSDAPAIGEAISLAMPGIAEGANEAHMASYEAPSADSPATLSFAAEAESLRTPHIDSVEDQLRGLLGLKVEIKLKTRDSGSIVIPFDSFDDFERLLRNLHRSAA